MIACLGVFFLILVLIKLTCLVTTYTCNSKVCLVGKTAIVTGGNTGIGFEIALNLASRGCRVIIANRSNGECSKNIIIKETGNTNVIWRHLDLSSFESTRKFAKSILSSEERLDILINNAGYSGINEYTTDGLLKTMQINYFSPFLLTHLLIELVKKTPESRIVFVSSGLSFIHQIKNANDMNKIPRSLLPILFEYANSKVCLMMSTTVFAQKLQKYNITCNSVHPGGVRSNIYKRSQNTMNMGFTKIFFKVLVYFCSMFFKSTEEGAHAVLQCAIDRKLENITGKFFADGFSVFQPLIVYNSSICNEIWKETEILVKLKPEETI